MVCEFILNEVGINLVEFTVSADVPVSYIMTQLESLILSGSKHLHTVQANNKYKLHSILMMLPLELDKSFITYS